MANYKILVFSGSFRKGSYNTALARAFIAAAPEGVSMELADFRNVPLFDQDEEVDFSPVVTALKDKIKTADGIIIVTPEYNRSIPGVLKNMLDYTGRPYTDNAWPGKAVMVAGASSSDVGTALAQYDLKKVLTYYNTHVMGQPEFYCGRAQDKFNEEGVLTDEATKKHIDSTLALFTAFIDKVR